MRCNVIAVSSLELLVYRLLYAVCIRSSPTLFSSFFLLQKKVTSREYHYLNISRKLQDAIDNVLWNEKEGVWLDYDTRNNRHRNTFYPSNLTPLYTMSYNFMNRRKFALKAVDYLLRNKVEEYFGEFLLISKDIRGLNRCDRRSNLVIITRAYFFTSHKTSLFKVKISLILPTKIQNFCIYTLTSFLKIIFRYDKLLILSVSFSFRYFITLKIRNINEAKVSRIEREREMRAKQCRKIKDRII